MKKVIVILALVLCSGLAAYAQRGGKAEPKLIEFARGRTSAVLSATLGRDEEMEYVFMAKKGQKVTVHNSKTGLFDVRIFSDETSLETEFDSSPTFSVSVPEDGPYMLFVRKKRVKTPARAKFSITLTIR